MTKEWTRNEKGLSIIPTNSAKIPSIDGWKKYQKSIAAIDLWFDHYLSQGYIGIICGEISGNLEVLDVDFKNDPTGKINDDFLAQIPEQLKQRLLIVSTPNKGLHIPYRCNEATIESNQKLALHTDGKVILETRGEGGYFCSHKVDYKVIQGHFDIENLDIEIPVVTANERELLIESARSLNRYYELLKKDKEGKPFKYNEPAINQFNDDYNIIELFEKHGWEIVNEDSGKKYLLRPGSTTSVHSGYYFTETNTFFCFSTSTPFESAKAYNHWQVLEVLEGIKDYRSKLKWISEKGCEPQNTSKKEKVTSDDITQYLNDKGVRYDLFLQDITINNEVITEMKYNTLYLDLKKHYDTNVSRPDFEAVIKSEYIKQFHPILDFIEKNKHRKPTGTFENWFSNVNLSNKRINRSYAVHFIKKWYVGIIAQGLDGQYPNEFFLALLSTVQGIGKTTFLRNSILPEGLRGYIAEHSLTSNDDFKVIMSQSLLVIDDEMDGKSYSDAQTFKNVLSNKKLTTRRKYDRRISNLQRRCSFCGSGNNLNIVREYQNRRIIPIEVESFNYEGLSSICYEDLFMEAYWLYMEGFKYSYQANEKEMLDSIYQDYQQKTDVELLIEEFIDLPESNEEAFFMPNIDIIEKLSKQHQWLTNRLNNVTLGKLMNDRGFKPQRRGRKKVSGYLIGNRSKILSSIEEYNSAILLGYEN